jgi:hypothetical protein
MLEIKCCAFTSLRHCFKIIRMTIKNLFDLCHMSISLVYDAKLVKNLFLRIVFATHLPSQNDSYVFVWLFTLLKLSFLLLLLFRIDDKTREMSQNNSLLNELWSTLANALDQIFQFRPMTREAYMTLYKSVLIFEH